MASQALPHQVQFYISYYDTTGYQSRLELLTAGSISSPVYHFLANKESDGPLCGAGYRDSLHSHACLSMLASSPTQSRVTKALLQTSMLVRQRYQSLRTPPKVPGFCPPDGVQVPLAFSTASL
jgi:hypothetical protein